VAVAVFPDTAITLGLFQGSADWSVKGFSVGSEILFMVTPSGVSITVAILFFGPGPTSISVIQGSFRSAVIEVITAYISLSEDKRTKKVEASIENLSLILYNLRNFFQRKPWGEFDSLFKASFLIYSDFKKTGLIARMN
jgi:hypothetical protein